MSRFLANDHLPRVSRQSCLLANDKGYNDVNPGAIHRLLAFILWQRKTSARRQSDEGCVTSYRLKRDPLPPNDVSWITQHVREGEGRKEGKGIAQIKFVPRTACTSGHPDVQVDKMINRCVA